ncbi:MAG: DHA2 family efflux MFS transporter permease subunit [Bacteriovoracaceae bacterium]
MNSPLLWLVAVGFFMETLDATIVNTALPTMARDLGASPLVMQSVVIGYALSLAVFIPASGWLTDRFGTRKVYLAAITIFTGSSILCAMAPTLPLLVAARVLQGLGGSLLLPVGRLTVLRNFPGEAYLPALSFVAMPALIGPLLGPTLGGWIVQFFTWHWIFLMNLPIGIFGFIASLKILPTDDPDPQTKKFDFLGFLQLSTFMVSISVALDSLSGNLLSKGIVLFLFIFGLAALAAYGIRALKQTRPLISPELFGVRTYSIGVLGNLFARIGSTCISFLLPMFFQLGLGYTPLQSGMAMLPLAIAAILSKQLIPHLVKKVGYRNFLITNTILVGLGVASFALLSAVENPVIQGIHLFIFGGINSMQFTVMNTLTMKDLDRRLSSQGNTLFSMVQMLAMSLSVAAAGTLLATFMESHEKIRAFHLTFLCMGASTITSTWLFAQLSPRKSS